jgi:ATP-dependent helicase/nuclease subunit B
MDGRRHYLGWERPFSVVFAERLQRESGGTAELDDWLIWAPSARAGRHVLNRFFRAESGVVEALHPPRIVTPAQFVRSLADGVEGLATEAQRLLTWKRVIEAAPGAQLRPAFPAVPADQLQQWSFAVAGQLMRLRARLAEDECTFTTVAARELPHDQQRWNVLAGLEQAYLARLAAAGLEDPDEWLAARLRAGGLEVAWRRLLVAGILNLSRREARCVEALGAAGIQVDSYLPYAAARAADFDELGRPLASVWADAPIPAVLLQERLQRAADPRELVDGVIRLGEAYGSRVDALVVGAVEAEVTQFLIERSRLAERPFYAPEGKPLAETQWGRLIRLALEWRRNGQLAVLSELLNQPLLRAWAAQAGVDAQAIAEALLRLRSERLLRQFGQLADPQLRPSEDVAAARAFVAELSRLLPDSAEPAAFPETIWTLLQQVADAAPLTETDATILGQLEELLSELQTDLAQARPSAAEYAELLNHLLADSRHFPEREAEERPVSGWLELPWETAPHLVLLGLPDAAVPGTRTPDPFLTPALCRELGLYGPDEMEAFHAFRLRLILESRREHGRVDILLADRGLDDSPQMPCRYLFLADQAEILDRVQLLLGERERGQAALPAHFGAQLKPPEPPPLKCLSVTAFRAYLANPFQFYLEHRMGWAAPEALPREIDAFGFGELAHSVLQALNESPEGAELMAAAGIAAFCEEALERAAAAQFGGGYPVPLRIQVDALRERLSWAAPLIAAERQAGWRPEKVEWAFHREMPPIEIDGVRLRGKIDLLERNTATGALRIVDYKTSDKGDSPIKAHLRGRTAASAEPLLPEQDFDNSAGRPSRWIDLQLPLYQFAVERLTGEAPDCAYFNLAKAVADVGLQSWCPDAGERAAALACAQAVIRAIRAGRFPLAKTRYADNWSAWFGGDIAAAIDPDWRQRHMEAAP